ncbi:MAG: Ger(x)C family spore germination protein [Bacillota bacterium]
MKRSRKPALAAVAITLVMSLSASGCWDRVELEDVAWVQAIGFDKGPEGFLATTLEIGVPRNLRGGGPMSTGGRDGPNYTTITIVSRTALEALDLAAINLGRRISLVQTQLYLFGEELAESDLRPLVSAMDRFREVRGSIQVAVVKGRAEDLLRVAESPLEVSPSRLIQTVLLQHMHTGLFRRVALARDLTNLLESSSMSPHCPIIALTADYPAQQGDGGGDSQGGQGGQEDKAEQSSVEPKVNLAELPPDKNTTDLDGWLVPKSGGGPIIIMGTAVFQGGRMVETLTGDETRGMLLAQNDLERATFAIPDPTAPDKPELALGVEIIGAKTKVKAARAGDKVKIGVNVHADVSYFSIKTQTDFTDPRMLPVAEKAIADHIKDIMDRAISKTQAVGADVFGFGDKLRRTFRTWPEFEAFAWLTKYPQAEIETEVEVDLHRFGLSLRPPVVPPSEILQTPR